MSRIPDIYRTATNRCVLPSDGQHIALGIDHDGTTSRFKLTVEDAVRMANTILKMSKYIPRKWEKEMAGSSPLLNAEKRKKVVLGWVDTETVDCGLIDTEALLRTPMVELAMKEAESEIVCVLETDVDRPEMPITEEEYELVYAEWVKQSPRKFFTHSEVDRIIGRDSRLE